MSGSASSSRAPARDPARRRRWGERSGLAREWRSEEHTSELQSLMRNSYAVFCLKKKKKQISNNNDIVTKTDVHRAKQYQQLNNHANHEDSRHCTCRAQKHRETQ